ncbi:polyamine ABC transporter substrate-binding protein [Ancylobacter defluvii]|uniref:Putrescine-binding periplasmic protein n=1 Tax=Ancylobacter defluvii TaxID=1282440 RepID=A0A9W6K2X8_9HYPH|nr:polyamine ABC transporter substrate-binding protein [Ancylobacter defluvii]MBS7586702.1 polyamine ABC transporter substrate-binding protein [Ancylobacter defluvii]GLK86003.1 putrescine-binding periplasmic protein [Ancylobacter defluvii]
MARLLATVAAGFLAALAISPASAQEKVVNVYNWSDYIDESVLEEFTKETGIKVRYDVFDSNEVLETKLLGGKTGYDVVVPTGSFLQRQIQAGVFLPLDKAKLPNIKDQWPMIAERLAVYDPGNQYAVNYMWGTTGIGMNVDKVKQRLGDIPLNSWDIVFKPEILSKLKDCGVYMLDGPEEIIPTALRYLGKDPNSKDPKDIEEAGKLLGKIRPFIKKFDSSGYINALAGGDICLATGWSGDVFQAKTRAEEAAEKTGKKPVNIEYVIPKEGALMWFDNFAIPKDAPHPEEALAFINFMMKPEVAAKNADYISYASGSESAQKFMSKDILENPAIYPDKETQAKLFTVTTYPQKVQRVVTKTWNDFKRGR